MTLLEMSIEIAPYNLKILIFKHLIYDLLIVRFPKHFR
jgi:hypothetical protein